MVRRVHSFETDDFETWYRDLHPRLHASMAHAFGDVALAEEVTDEALARALERWERVHAMDAPEGWVYRVAFNEARRRLRRSGMEQRLLRRERVEPADPPAGELWAVVADLPIRQRQAVVLRHVGDLREAEIGEAMGVTRGTVSATLRAAYASLRIAVGDPAIDPAAVDEKELA